ncbi:hypothetical protein B0T24DRAFT_676725 [Lasiosphaeria ovina]|uniref:Uncharacterized protein n=1 Tax=Lasiosphaeria ovina TaxID=92902 RepID=A0AAE0KG14_9PEZI|nr:hypothetical protein B0T24DRAFT_676725 [Lasiosphaeria ovina]
MEFDFTMTPEERVNKGSASLPISAKSDHKKPWDWTLQEFKNHCITKNFNVAFDDKYTNTEKENTSNWWRRIGLLVNRGCLGPMIGAMLATESDKRPTAAQVLAIAEEHARDPETLFGLDPTAASPPAGGAGGPAQQATSKASQTNATVTARAPKRTAASVASRSSTPTTTNPNKRGRDNDLTADETAELNNNIAAAAAHQAPAK